MRYALQMLSRTSLELGRLLEGLIGILVAASVVAILCQVMSRYLTSVPLYWMEELARYLMVWIVLVGAALGFRSVTHFRLAFLLDLLSPRVRYVCEKLLDGVTVAFLVVFIAATVPLLSIAEDQTSPGLGVSMLLLYLALPVGAVLMTVFLIIGIVGGSHHLTPREQAEREKADAEGVSPGVGID